MPNRFRHIRHVPIEMSKLPFSGLTGPTRMIDSAASGSRCVASRASTIIVDGRLLSDYVDLVETSIRQAGGGTTETSDVF